MIRENSRIIIKVCDCRHGTNTPTCLILLYNKYQLSQYKVIIVSSARGVNASNNHIENDDLEPKTKRLKHEELDGSDQASAESTGQVLDPFSIYSAYPYLNQNALDVGMHHFAILVSGSDALLYEINETADFVQSIPNVSFLCATGSSSCIIIYANVENYPDISAIAHASCISSLNQVMQFMQIALAEALNKKSDEIHACFYHFGGTSESIKNFREDEGYPSPESCRIDINPRCFNASEHDSIDVFATSDGLIIKKNANNKSLYYKQSYYFDTKPTLVDRAKQPSRGLYFTRQQAEDENGDPDSSSDLIPSRKRKRE